nr:MAG TPA: hypothetical protein [Caudoviricetes sp.]
MPLKCENIMAGDDIKMNSFAQATDAAYIYAESSNGSQVKIKKSDLVEVIRAAMPVVTTDKNGLYSKDDFPLRGYTNKYDLNTINRNARIRISNIHLNGPVAGSNYGCLRCSVYEEYILQEYWGLDGILWVRQSTNKGETWEEWKSVKST